RRPHRFVGRVAAGGVRQQHVLRRVDVVEQRFLRAIRDIHAPDGDRDHLGAGGLVRLHHDRRRGILSGADDQARRKGLIRDCEEVHYPPPTKLTISTSSPSRTVVRSNRSRLTTTRLCSTATRRGSISSRARSSVTVKGPASSCASPFNVMRNF